MYKQASDPFITGSKPRYPVQLRNVHRLSILLNVRDSYTPRVTDAVSKEFQEAWRALYPRLRRLKKSDDYDDEVFWAEWEAEFAYVLLPLLKHVASELGSSEFEWFSFRGYPGSSYDIESIYSRYEEISGHSISGITQTTHQRVHGAIAKWLTGHQSFDELISSLEPWFSSLRARKIAITEISSLTSAATYELMKNLKISKWSWYSRLDYRTCGFCRRLHGTVFSLHDPMPPAHVSCQCLVAPFGV